MATAMHLSTTAPSTIPGWGTVLNPRLMLTRSIESGLLPRFGPNYARNLFFSEGRRVHAMGGEINSVGPDVAGVVLRSLVGFIGTD